jgi:diguanylate cyclase (GGDEF)-like protein
MRFATPAALPPPAPSGIMNAPPGHAMIDGPDDPGPEALALDTLASILRSLAEFAQDQERTSAADFRQVAEAWAQHVAVATPPPGPPQPAEAASGRRDWQGIRRFVREYCRSSSVHAASVSGGLRDVIWVFIRDFGQALASDEDSDQRVREQLARLERLAASNDVAELRREAGEAAAAIARAVEERRARQRRHMATLGEAVKALGSELETARREGDTDALTRVYNRKALDACVARAIEYFQAFRHDTCLLLVDVDRFKAINDGAGHAAGDHALRGVADVLGKVFMRRSDVVARYGGDEFAVILRETSLRDAAPLADRVLGRARALRVDGVGEVTLSIGVAALAAGEDAAAWFKRADAALYAAKAAGRDRFAVAPPPEASAG